MDEFMSKFALNRCRCILTGKTNILLVILAHAILTVEIEGISGSRGAKKVIESALYCTLQQQIQTETNLNLWSVHNLTGFHDQLTFTSEYGK